MSFSAIPTLVIGSLLCAAAIVIALLRRPRVPRATMGAAVCGLMLLAFAAGGPRWRIEAPIRIAVMLDTSPSMRGAMYHDRALLNRRIAELLGATRYDLYEFADQRLLREPIESAPAELAVARTVFQPPPADAIVLFSDARFRLPQSAPPTYVIVDPNLERAADARVTAINVQDERAVADVTNDGDQQRELVLTAGGAAIMTATIPHGQQFLATTQPLRPASTITARLSAADAWPENDQLSIVAPAPAELQRWWVSHRAAPAGWLPLSPAQLPAQPTEFLAAAVVALDDVPADAFTDAQLERLEQYVRDLGGGLLICGGEHAFAAGRYSGTRLEAISPLSSTPPEPTTHWVLLCDSSGSMAAPVAAEVSPTRFDIAAHAIAEAMAHLPPNDAVSVGNFARDLRWWITGKTVKDAAGLKLPPPDVAPQGPTNLQAALSAVAAAADGSLPTELFVITDGEAKFEDVDRLVQQLIAKRVRVHLLLTTDRPVDPALQTIIQRTGGQLLQQADSTAWSSNLRRLLSAASPDELIKQPIDVRFVQDLYGLDSRTLSPPINRTWLKPGAQLLASSAIAAEHLPLAARWRLGSGSVVSAAFTPDTAERERMAQLVAQPPRDPRFAVSFQTGSTLTVSVQAQNAGKYMNGLELTLKIISAAGGELANDAIPQSAPGEYRLEIPAPAQPGFATVSLHDQVLDRFAVAGRYAAEFDAIGNDHEAMQELAARSGGAVIEPSSKGPIQLPKRDEVRDLTPVFSIAGAAAIAIALIIWRRAA